MSWHRHAAHAGDPAQLLADNCPQCEDLAKAPADAIRAMESDAFESAWQRAVDWNGGRLTSVSAAEVPVLQVLLAFTSQFARRGIEWGTVPGGVRERVGA